MYTIILVFFLCATVIILGVIAFTRIYYNYYRMIKAFFITLIATILLFIVVVNTKTVKDCNIDTQKHVLSYSDVIVFEYRHNGISYRKELHGVSSYMVFTPCTSVKQLFFGKNDKIVEYGAIIDGTFHVFDKTNL